MQEHREMWEVVHLLDRLFVCRIQLLLTGADDVLGIAISLFSLLSRYEEIFLRSHTLPRFTQHLSSYRPDLHYPTLLQ